MIVVVAVIGRLVLSWKTALNVTIRGFPERKAEIPLDVKLIVVEYPALVVAGDCTFTTSGELVT
jgi:hypothetical protein